MATDFWARVRRLFGKRVLPRELEQVLGDWRAEERPDKSVPAEERERLHPLKGWIREGSERAPNRINVQPKVRHPAQDRNKGR
jgi:hypothetical protein